MSTTHPLSDRIDGILPRLYKYAANHATTELTSDDLVQLATIEILTHCSPSDNDTYMLRLADWRMKNAVKRERSYSFRLENCALETEADDDNEIIISDITNLPEERLMENEASSAITRVIQSLKPDQVILLGMLQDGLSQREIARRLKTSQQRIGYHVQKIREVFRTAGLSPSLSFA